MNQHGDNRGDEAAMRAMLSELDERIDGAKFTVLHQFADRELRIRLSEDVTLAPMFRSVRDLLSLAAYAVLRMVRIRVHRVLSAPARQVIDGYESADLVISAPGGPYFGDVYRRHEVVHWFYVWLAGQHGCPVVLYAPSAGPFRNRLLGRLRRRMFRRFYEPLCVREPTSEGFLRDLLGSSCDIEVTADSAFQVRISPAPRSELPVQDANLVVAVSLIEYAFPGTPDPAGARARYERAVRCAVEHIHHVHSGSIVFFPQLYGRVHSDVEYLSRFASSLAGDIPWQIVDESLDSDGQRALIGACDLVIASRYHPQVFAISAGVPGVCIYYEHKALGLMRQVGLERFAFDIRALEPRTLVRAVDDLVADSDRVVEVLRTAEPMLRERARRTTEVTVRALADPTA